MYKQYMVPGRTDFINVIRLTDGWFIPFDHNNTDYQKFKIDLTNGAQLTDANNNVMTSDQVTAFIATLP